jgi:hypothetical protein
MNAYDDAGHIAHARSMRTGEYDREVDATRSKADPLTGEALAALRARYRADEPLDLVTDDVKKSAATVLVDLAVELYEFGCSSEGEPYAVPRSGPKVIAMLRGGRSSLRAQLARRYFARTRKAAPQQALADALLVVEGMALERDPVELHLRVARAAGAIWLDLADETGEVVRIGASGWQIVSEAPVLFRRTALNAPLPRPTAGGCIDELWRWLNVSPDDRPLLIAFLVAALHPAIPHPILELAGEQGTGKTTAERTIVSVIDPSPVPTRKAPRDADSWVSAAAGSWVVGIDNVSAMPEWRSDSLCRAVTGDGDVRRRLYTDGDLHVVAFRRVVIITGIDLGAIRGDLAERLLPIELSVIDSSHRLEEADLWPAWEHAHPRILGALLDLVASCQAVAPSVELETRPRMADFARVVACVDRVLGTDGLARYITKQSTLAAEALTGDSFVAAMIDTLKATFTGTSTDLLARIPTPERTPKGWPTNPRSVTTILRRQAPVMRKAGWTVTDDGAANQAHATRWSITPPPEMARNPSSPTSFPRHDEPNEPTSNGHRPSHDDEPIDEDTYAAYMDEDR